MDYWGAYCSIPGISNDESGEGSNWMKKVDGKLTLNDLSIPCTHDSMAYKGDLNTIYVLTQSLSLCQQLRVGVRFFDIRLKVTQDSRLGVYHGIIFLQNHFEDVLNEFNDFLNKNPSEAVLFRYLRANEDDADTTFCDIFNNEIKRFSERIWGYQPNFDADTMYDQGLLYPTLDEMRQKMVILRVNEESTKDCFGHTFDKKELDNFNGKEKSFNEFTGNRPVSKMVHVAKNKRKKRATNGDPYVKKVKENSKKKINTMDSSGPKESKKYPGLHSLLTGNISSSELQRNILEL